MVTVCGCEIIVGSFQFDDCLSDIDSINSYLNAVPLAHSGRPNRHPQIPWLRIVGHELTGFSCGTFPDGERLVTPHKLSLRNADDPFPIGNRKANLLGKATVFPQD
jgi:hypothetical protein